MNTNTNISANTYPDWIMNIFKVVADCWTYAIECDHINFKANLNKQKKEWEIWCAPIGRELYAGEFDGKKFWSPFVFNNHKFGKNSNVFIDESFMTSAKSISTNSVPQMIIKGKYKNKNRKNSFLLHILMEPEVSSKSIEVLDTIQNKILTQKEEIL